MDEKKISVIMPVYNVVDYVEKAVKSIIQQTYKNLELILIDDGSNDGSEDVCLKLAQLDARIRLIRKKNQGVSAARNDGLNIASGEYITFVDPDDWLEPDAYETMLEYMYKTNSDICVMGFITEGSRAFKVSLKKEIQQVFNKEEGVNNLIDGEIYTWSIGDKIYSRNIIQGVKFSKDILNGEDFLFNWKVFRQAEKIAYIPLHGYHYVERYDSMANTFSEKKLTVTKAFEYVLDDCKNNRDLYKKIQIKYIKTMVGIIYLYFKFNNRFLYDYKFVGLKEAQKLIYNEFYNIIWFDWEVKYKLLALIIILPLPLKILIFRIYFRFFSY